MVGCLSVELCFCYSIVIKIVRFKNTSILLYIMLVDQETIKKIKSLGLNTYEVKIWTALLSRGVSTAGELSDIANVPRSRSYDVLESLEKKGFVVMKLGKPIKYLAVPPKEVLENVRGQIEKSTEKHISYISGSSFSNLINNLQEVHESAVGVNEEVVAVLKGKNIQKHICFLFKNAKKEILLSSSGAKEHFDVLGNIKAKQKNIEVRVIGSKEFSGGSKGAMPRVCVVDENVVLFPVDTKDTHLDYDIGIWFRNKNVAHFFKKLLSD